MYYSLFCRYHFWEFFKFQIPFLGSKPSFFQLFCNQFHSCFCSSGHAFDYQIVAQCSLPFFMRPIVYSSISVLLPFFISWIVFFSLQKIRLVVEYYRILSNYLLGYFVLNTGRCIFTQVYCTVHLFNFLYLVSLFF